MNGLSHEHWISWCMDSCVNEWIAERRDVWMNENMNTYYWMNEWLNKANCLCQDIVDTEDHG